MARSLPALPMQKLPFLIIPTSYFLVIIAVLSVFSIVTFLCAGFHHNNFKQHRKREKQTVQLGEKKTISRLQSNISSKALLMVKMISWSKVRDDEEEEEEMDGDEAVWRRKIMMGERCRPLDFSGKILYDSHGNLLPNTPLHQSQSNNGVSLGKS
ncbi:hypothetical protein RHMOL_Rhmol10G0098000 [Rhododendron molle]|uniref:Uncharacterized protein n=1 Tax=Rhododendron molle TaxID=49168 RepID=A0ACC0M1W1_RHOML|nr:hypothetical protein RHMOL_Rhmol10G0098000 [Rhododendron molle]